MNIYVRHDPSEESMGFTSETMKLYDFAASLKRYEEMLEANLLKEFPGAEVEIERGWYDVAVDWDREDDEVGGVEAVIADTFGSFNWLIPFK